MTDILLTIDNVDVILINHLSLCMSSLHKHLSSLPGEVLPVHDPLGVGVVLDLFHDRMYLAHIHMVC